MPEETHKDPQGLPSLAHAPEEPAPPPAPAPKPAKKEPPAAPPAPPEKPDPRKGLLILAKEKGLVGLPLAQALVQYQVPGPWGIALGHIAFAINTGLGGHKAAEGLRKAGAEGLAQLAEDCLDKSEADVVAIIRERWPEK